MKNDESKSELIARFGEAKIVRRKNGWYELLGGRPEDRFEAREWASIFLHEAVLGDNPPRVASMPVYKVA